MELNFSSLIWLLFLFVWKKKHGVVASQIEQKFWIILGNLVVFNIPKVYTKRVYHWKKYIILIEQRDFNPQMWFSIETIWNIQYGHAFSDFPLHDISCSLNLIGSYIPWCFSVQQPKKSTKNVGRQNFSLLPENTWALTMKKEANKLYLPRVNLIVLQCKC